MYSYQTSSTIQLGGLLVVNLAMLLAFRHDVILDPCNGLSFAGLVFSSYSTLLSLGLLLCINSGNIKPKQSGDAIREWMDKHVTPYWYANFWISFCTFCIFTLGQVNTWRVAVMLFSYLAALFGLMFAERLTPSS